MNSFRKKLSYSQELRILKKVLPAIFDFEFRFVPVLKYALVPLLIMLMVVLPAFAYASPSVNQEHWLFPVKKAMENIEYDVAPAEKKVAKLEKFAERRLDEVEQIVKKEDYKSETVVATLEEVQKINQEIKNKEPQGKALGQQQVLEVIAQSVGLEAEEEVVDQVAKTIEEAKPEPKQNRFNFSWPKVEESDETDREAVASTAPKWSPRETMDKYKQEINEYIEDLNKEVEVEQTEKLQQKINDKFEKVEKQLEKGNDNAAEGLLKATEALGNNAEHFLKAKERFEQIKADIDKKQESIEDSFDENRGVNKNNSNKGAWGFGHSR
jgi:hypothetical protein